MARHAWYVDTALHSFGESRVRWTTLYDLVASLREVADAEQEHLLTPLVLNFLQTYHVTWWYRQRGYRLVCDPRLESAVDFE